MRFGNQIGIINIFINNQFAIFNGSINIVQLMARGGGEDVARLRVRTFEKGVEAETLACGTGSIASSLVTALTGLSSAQRFDVEMPGGVLSVGFDGTAEDPQNLYLEGAADTIYRGNLEL